MMFFK
jgi:hypothetical protein